MFLRCYLQFKTSNFISCFLFKIESMASKVHEMQSNIYRKSIRNTQNAHHWLNIKFSKLCNEGTFNFLLLLFVPFISSSLFPFLIKYQQQQMNEWMKQTTNSKSCKYTILISWVFNLSIQWVSFQFWFYRFWKILSSAHDVQFFFVFIFLRFAFSFSPHFIPSAACVNWLFHCKNRQPQIGHKDTRTNSILYTIIVADVGTNHTHTYTIETEKFNFNIKIYYSFSWSFFFHLRSFLYCPMIHSSS